MSACFANVCRVCMQEHDQLISLASADEDFIEHNAKLFFCIPSLKVDDESHPQQLCAGCSADLRVAYDFKQRTLNSAHLISEILKSEAAAAAAVVTPALETAAESQLKQEMFEATDEKPRLDEEHSYTRAQDGCEPADVQVKVELVEEERAEDGHSDGQQVPGSTPAACERRTSTGAVRRSSVAAAGTKKRASTSEYYCSLCDEGFGGDQLSQHRQLHEALRTVTCPLCSRQFRASELERFFRHYCQQPSRPSHLLTCTVCYRKFKSTQALANHRKVHEASHKQFTCHFCQLNFGSMQRLDWHYRNGVHTDRHTNKLRHLNT